MFGILNIETQRPAFDVDFITSWLDNKPLKAQNSRPPTNPYCGIGLLGFHYLYILIWRQETKFLEIHVLFIMI